MQIVLLSIFLITLLSLVIDIIKSAQNRNLFDLITYSFILIYGLIRPIHLQIGDLLHAKFYVFGGITTEIPELGLNIYAFSYILFYIIYKLITSKHSLKLKQLPVLEPQQNKGIFLLSLGIYIILANLRSVHPIFVSFDLVQIVCVLLIHYTFPYRSGLLTFLIGSVLITFHFIDSNERRDVLVLIFVILAMGYQNKVVKAYISNVFVSIIAFLCIVISAIYMRSGFSFKNDSIFFEAVVRKLEIELDFPIVTDTTSLAIQSAYDNNIYYWGESMVKPFLYFIPRSLLPEKPETISRVVAKENFLGFYYEGGSVPVGIMGEAFLNFSFVGIIIYAIIYSYLITLGTRLFVSNSVILRQVSWTIAASIFYILRGPIDTMLIGFIVLFFYIGYVKKFVVNHQK